MRKNDFMKNFSILSIIIIVLLLVQYFFGPDKLIPLAVSFSLISVATSVWLSLEQYSLKLKSEKVETDVKLLTLFTKIMQVAHGRGGYIQSEKVIEKLFDTGVMGVSGTLDSNEINQKISSAAILLIPVGEAEQDAAIAAIANLASRHDVLKEAAIEGLKSISKFRPDPTNKYMEKIR